MIAQALQDAGVGVVTHVPGTGASDSFRLLNGARPVPFPLSLHEEVAFTIAHGAALAGTRSAALIKVHGLAKAANSVLDAMLAGTTAGLVLLVFDDPQGRHSDGILATRALLGGLQLPVLTPPIGKIYDALRDGFQTSEALRLPVAVIVNTDEMDAAPERATRSGAEAPPGYGRDIVSHVLCPPFAAYQRQVLEAKLAGREWRSLARPSLPVCPDDLPANWQDDLRAFMPVFEVFKTVRGRIVTGDPGLSALFAFPPFACVDICTYMGGSLPLALGAMLAGYPDCWAITGDFGFCAAGHLALLEAQYRGLPLKAIIFYNGKARATGGQLIPTPVLETILAAYKPFVRFIRNPQDKPEIERVLREANAAPEMRIVVADYVSGGI